MAHEEGTQGSYDDNEVPSQPTSAVRTPDANGSAWMHGPYGVVYVPSPRMSPPTVHAEDSAPVITNSRRTPSLASERSSLISPLHCPPGCTVKARASTSRSRGYRPELTRTAPAIRESSRPATGKRGSWAHSYRERNAGCGERDIMLYLYMEGEGGGGLFFVLGRGAKPRFERRSHLVGVCDSD